jgi:hypothetical protein
MFHELCFQKSYVSIPPSPQPAVPSAPPLDSRIISDFPEIFAEFRGKRFEILWRGGRDGFGAREFHRRCDGRFTPVEWELNSGCKADDSLRSFLFTLKNPRNIPARRFALKAEEKQRAINCGSGWGPGFGDCDIVVSDNCNANANSFTCLGLTSTDSMSQTTIVQPLQF